MADRLRNPAVILLLLITVARGLFYVLVIPPWQTPDEPSHFGYVSFVRENHRLPASASLPVSEQIVASMSRFGFWKMRYNALEPISLAESQELRIAAGHPPLYYLLGALLLAPFRSDDVVSQLYALRLGSVLMGALTVLVAFWTVKSLFADDVVLPLAASAFISFLPMHTFISASVNNDNLAELVASLLILLLVLLLRDGVSPIKAAGVAVLVCAGLLTKRTTFFTVPLTVAFVPVYFWTRAERVRQSTTVGHRLLASITSQALQARMTLLRGHRFHIVLAIIVLLALVSGVLWTFLAARRVGQQVDATAWVRQYATERQYLPLCTKPPNRPVAHLVEAATREILELLRVSPRQVESALSAERIVPSGFASYPLFGLLTFASFWANFGWMNVPLDPPWYALLAVISLLAFLGLLLRIAREVRSSGEEALLPRRWQKGALLILMLAPFLILVQTFGLMVIQNIPQQGRYLFPAMVPISTLFVLGLSEVVPERYRHRLPLVCILSLFVFDILCLTRYIVPHYYG